MKKKWKIIGILILIVALAVAGVGVWQYFQEKNAGSDYEQLREEVVKKEPTPTASSEESSSEEAETQVSSAEIPIDFATLQAENPEIYAWITVPGTNVDYPILQSETDNAYYLSHTYTGEEKAEGAIFTENYNTKTFDDPNTVIYGHDMKNGSMFQSLHDFMDKDFFDQHKDVTIYMPDKILHYQIFAAYLTDNRHIMQSYDFNDKDVFAQYLQEVKSQRGAQAFVDDSVEVNADSKIITLSTCYAGISTSRYLVQAVLVSIDQ